MSAELFSAEHSSYKYGFVNDVETESIPKGLTEETIRSIWIDQKNLRRAASVMNIITLNSDDVSWTAVFTNRINKMNITIIASI